MKLDFSKKAMDIGTRTFNFVRTLSVAPTGGAEINECLLAAERIQNDGESWVAEWTNLADKAYRTAEVALAGGQTVTARQAYLRASNYHRAILLSLACTDTRFDDHLTLNRECFHKAAPLCSPSVEILEIAVGSTTLPAYFMSGGTGQRPTLLAINGGDSTNEELVHWVGWAAQKRGWNCLIFEGPGQMSGAQRNPGVPLRPDWEVLVRAVVDELLCRDNVHPDQIALYGTSLGAMLAARSAAFERRVCACICQGLVVDVYEAWHGVWPRWLQRAKPATFDRLFGLLEKVSPQVRKLASIFRRMLGVSSASAMIRAWRPFSVKELGSQITCPFLVLYGEAEYAEQSAGPLIQSMAHFLSELAGPASIHEFTYDEGWAATHCQVGGLSAFQTVAFDWLENVVIKKDTSPGLPFSPDLIRKHYGKNPTLAASFEGIRLSLV